MSFYPDGVGRANLAMAGSSGNAINTQGGESITDSPGLQGSMQQVLMDNLGQYVQIDFLIGINTIVRQKGILYSVGRSYVVLYDETEQDFILCDVFSAKFISFYGTRRPGVSALNPGLGIVQPDAMGTLRPIVTAAGMTGDRQGVQGGMGNVQGDLGRYFDQGSAPSQPGCRTLGDR